MSEASKGKPHTIFPIATDQYPVKFGEANNDWFMCFTSNHDGADAIAKFVKTFGHEPEQAFIQHRLLWLGPAYRKGQT